MIIALEPVSTPMDECRHEIILGDKRLHLGVPPIGALLWPFYGYDSATCYDPLGENLEVLPEPGCQLPQSTQSFQPLVIPLFLVGLLIYSLPGGPTSAWDCSPQ